MLYVKEAQSLLDGVARECEKHVVVNPDHTLSFDHIPSIPKFLPLAISDCVHNIRSGMDYLIYELAKLDSGVEQDGTQFPIEHTKLGKSANGNIIGFDAVKDKLLKGLSTDHIDRIEALQPYRGVNWTKTLRNISNPDKHRKLTEITNDRASLFFVSGPPKTGIKPRGKKLPDGQYLYAYAYQAVCIILPEGECRIVDTLWSLISGADEAVRGFHSDF